jgi:hypothetical protein
LRSKIGDESGPIADTLKTGVDGGILVSSVELEQIVCFLERNRLAFAKPE